MNGFGQDLINFFRPGYLFEPGPGEFQTYGSFFVVFFVILGVIGVIFGLLGRIAKKIPEIKAYFYRRLATMLLTGSILGLLYVFIREQGVIYLSSRLVLLLILAGMVMWLGYLVYFAREISKKIAEDNKKKEMAKYLPKKKKK